MRYICEIDQHHYLSVEGPLSLSFEGGTISPMFWEWSVYHGCTGVIASGNYPNDTSFSSMMAMLKAENAYLRYLLKNEFSLEVRTGFKWIMG